MLGIIYPLRSAPLTVVGFWARTLRRRAADRRVSQQRGAVVVTGLKMGLLALAIGVVFVGILYIGLILPMKLSQPPTTEPPSPPSPPQRLRTAVEFDGPFDASDDAPGEPDEAGVARVQSGLEHSGLSVEDVVSNDYAVLVVAWLDTIPVRLSVGWNEDGPWLGIVEVDGSPTDAERALSAVHDALGRAGATRLRWFDEALHGRGVEHTPWSTPLG